ncbi:MULTISPECIES: DUF6520 family protein [Flavobacterium]|uniref:Uncharacterized protein n=1 Tax=Flavobacterium macrobrachii TaxID=591204 RepID=A0ABS2CXP4_9FLAO|nr:DUF6520 family protein [Flavobacterium macrobrachii]MBM6499676.1 hypothetical protein [Flavobacterium macrobrachii]
MKTILKVILPVLAFTLASAGAVSSKNAKVKEAKKTVSIIGFIQNPSIANCLQVTVDCTPTTTIQNCMSSEATPRRVWHKNAANACSVNLYKVL